MGIRWLEQEALVQAAKDVISLAADGGMPDTYWHTDQRIERALKVLGWTPHEALLWAEGQRERL